MSILSYLSFLAAVLYVVAGGHVLARYRDNALSRLFFLMCLSLAIWAFGYSMVTVSPSEAIARNWLLVSTPGFLLFGPLFLHFSVKLARKKDYKLPLWKLALLYSPAFIVMVMSFAIDNRQYFEMPKTGFGFEPHVISLHPLTLAMSVLISIWLFAGIIFIGRWVGDIQEHAKRLQGRLLLILSIIISITNFVSEIGFPAFGIHDIPTTSHIITIVWVVSIWLLRFQPFHDKAYSAIMKERDHLADRLQESEETYRVLVDNLNVGIFRILPGQNQQILLANPALSRLLGFSSVHELLKQNSAVLFRSEADSEALLEELVLSGSVRNRIIELKRRDGKAILVSFTARAVRSSSGETRFIDGVLEDVTERESAMQSQLEKQKNLEHLVESLEQRVEIEYTGNLDKEQLLVIQSRQALMGDMIATIAHQWKNPLNGLSLLFQNLTVLSESPQFSSESVRTKSKKGLEIVNHMSQTIDDFQNFFRPDKLVSTFNVLATAKKCVEIYSLTLQKSHIHVDLQMNDPVTAAGFANEYSQVIMNILSNAKDALIQNQVKKPEIRIRAYTENGKSVLSITDNAGGIPESILPNIFNPYFSTKKDGTGIGLSISKTIMEKNMKGHLECRNIDWDKGYGAEFILVL